VCGIFGIYNINNNKSFDEKKIESSIQTMQYRGPNARGIKTFKDKAALAHLRLSIIDLKEESNQPFQVDDQYWITYNGEVYNYIELKEELLNYGLTFRTESDTEVILRAYQHWGEDCVTKFNGMWAFAIYNKEKNELFCSRDRFGVKPFNYALVENQFVFSSEIKAMIHYFPQLKKPNYNVIANFCRTSIGAQIKETWFENVFRLEPAHNIIINQNGIQLKKYWDYPKKVNYNLIFEKACKEYKELLQDAVKIRMRSDVAVGFTLSSGIDSTSIVSLLKSNFNNNKNTYTASFSNTGYDILEKQNFKKDIVINEPAIVRKLTSEIGINSKIVEINYSNYIEELQKIIFHLESGHGSPAISPLYQILKEAKKDVTVVLEGQGADELLGGYINNIFPIYILELIKNFKFRKSFHEIKVFIKTYSLKATFMLWVRQLNIQFIKNFFFKITGQDSLYIGKIKKYKPLNDYPNKPHGFSCSLNNHLYKSHSGGLVNLLHYGDAISMAHSLESRLPFMDYRLVEFAFSLPYEFKVNKGKGKYIHRMAMQGIVPDYILNNEFKFGFESPISHLFKSESNNSCKSILLSEKCINRGLFNKNKLNKYFTDHFNGKKNNSRILYRMLQIELWFREFID
jgi:asparagine synthase (glutamine-hydrolysing)